MAGTVNKVILIGNLGKDPEVRRLENGAVVANFPIATSESYTDKNGQKIEHTDWHDIVVWRGLAEIAEKYLRKGHKIYVEGRLKKRSYQDKDNQTRYISEVLADEFTMLTRPDNANEQKPNEPNYSNEGTPNKMENLDLNDKDEDVLPF